MRRLYKVYLGDFYMSIRAELVKMPYLGEDEHTTDVKSAAMATSNSNTSDAEDVEMNLENKVSQNIEQWIRTEKMKYSIEINQFVWFWLVDERAIKRIVFELSRRMKYSST